MRLVIENDPDEKIYRIGEGGDEDNEDRLEGEIVSWGEEASIEVEGRDWKACVSAEGQFDGFIYEIGGGEAQRADIEEWDLKDEYEDQEDDDDDEDDDEDEDPDEAIQ